MSIRAFAAVIAIALLALTPPAASADGKVFRTGLAIPVAIPDQEAMIVFDAAKRRQTLAIETRFDPGSAPSEADFAWVVPLPGPNAPEVRPATTGLFPTLRQTFLPHVTVKAGETTGITLSASVVVVLVLIAGAAHLRGWRMLVQMALIGLIFLIVCAALLPALGGARGGYRGGHGVAVLDRQVVGSYEVTTIAPEPQSENPDAGRRLGAWLREGGFVMPDGVEPVLHKYAAKNWVFAACKLSVTGDAAGKLPAPHPLVFEFDTPQAVYPMQLTGVGNGPLAVDLYVFGVQEATATGFNLERCEPNVEYPLSTDRRSLFSRRTVTIGHTQAQELAAGMPVATKLTAKLSPDQQRDDVVLGWKAPQRSGESVYTRDAAASRAFEYASGVLLLSLIIIVIITAIRKETARWALRQTPVALILMAAGWLVAWLPLPVYAGQTVNGRWAWYMDHGHERVCKAIRENQPQAEMPTPEALRSQVAAQWLVELSISRLTESERALVMPRHEDSPGNYTIDAEADGTLTYHAYDNSGKRRVVESWAPTRPAAPTSSRPE